MADDVKEPTPSLYHGTPVKLSQFIRRNGKRVDHVCDLPRPLFLIRRFKAGDRWRCSCDKVYRYGRSTLMVALGIKQMEWLRI